MIFFPLDFTPEKLCSTLNSSEVGFRHAFNISPVKIHYISEGFFWGGGWFYFGTIRESRAMGDPRLLRLRSLSRNVAGTAVPRTPGYRSQWGPCVRARCRVPPAILLICCSFPTPLEIRQPAFSPSMRCCQSVSHSIPFAFPYALPKTPVRMCKNRAALLRGTLWGLRIN